MSYQSPDPANPSPDSNTGSSPVYSVTPGRSRMALWSMILGIVAIPTTVVIIGFPLGMAALVLGIISLVAIHKDPALGRKGMAISGIVLGALSFTMIPIALLIAILVPSLGRARELANRSACGANLRGLGMALEMYANDNSNQFPLVQYAPYSPALNNPSGTAVGDAKTTSAAYYAAGPANQAGSPTAGLWIPVLQGNVPPKQFLCKSDPFAAAPAATTDATGNYFNNFQSGSQLSYSVAYPWDTTGRVLPHWKATADAMLPLASDMAPLDGTGTPPRHLAVSGRSAAAPKTYNSANHGGEGQNILFADSHVEFRNGPWCGQGGDNIWTLGPGAGTPVTPGPLSIPAPEGPTYDTVMVPVRDATTGGM